MDYKLSGEDHFSIAITSKQYNIVKFITGDQQIKAQKIFKIELKHP
jgi:stress-induced morphogen